MSPVLSLPAVDLSERPENRRFNEQAQGSESAGRTNIVMEQQKISR